jgi:membrane protein YdbS with pleckstrin-like domain
MPSSYHRIELYREGAHNLQSQQQAARPSVALPYTIQPSSLARWVPVGWSLFSGFVTLPWRGFAVWLLLFVAWLQISAILEPSDRWIVMGFAALFFLGVAACVSEMAFRTDYLTSAGLERRSGLLGRKRLVVPYASIELVKVEEPGLGTSFDVGDVIVRANGREHRLAYVLEPYEIASAIESLRVDRQGDDL